MPGGWISCTLEDLSLFIRNGVTLKQTKIINGFPITRIESISNGVLDFDKMGYADLTDEDLYKSYFLRPNDILFSHINSPIYVGKVALCDNVGERKIVHGMNLLCIRISEVVNSRYILYAIRSSVFKDKMRHYVQNAVNQASISINSVKIIPLPLPPINEQNRIVEEIEKWYDLIRVLENNKQDLQKYIKSARSEILKLAITGKLVPQNNTDEPAYELLKRINPSINSCDTSHYENLPKGWTVCELQDVIELLDNKRKPIKSEERTKRIEGKTVLYPYYGATGFVGYIDEYLIDGRFILLGEDGAPFLDKFAEKAYAVEGKIWVNNHAHVILPKIDFDYLKLYLNALDYHGIAKGTTRLKLTQGDMNKIPVLVPPLEEQKRISKCVQKMFEVLNAITDEL